MIIYGISNNKNVKINFLKSIGKKQNKKMGRKNIGVNEVGRLGIIKIVDC